MKKNFVTMNGMVLTNSKAIINYLNSVFETFVTTTQDLYDPCIIYYEDGRWSIDSWSPYTLDHIKYWEFNNVFMAYMFIRHEENREVNNRKYGIFGFNDEAVVRIERPNRPLRKPRYSDIDVTKTTLFRAPKENENRYMPVYAF